LYELLIKVIKSNKDLDIIKGLGFWLIENCPNLRRINRYSLLFDCVFKKLNLIFVKFIFI